MHRIFLHFCCILYGYTIRDKEDIVIYFRRLFLAAATLFCCGRFIIHLETYHLAGLFAVIVLERTFIIFIFRYFFSNFNRILNNAAHSVDGIFEFSWIIGLHALEALRLMDPV